AYSWQWLFERDPSVFPDIDQAWAEALQALDEANIDWKNVPLFLVLGRPAEGEEPFFRAAQMPFKVRNIPGGPDEPLHVYGSHDGIFISCPGASLFGSEAVSVALAGQVRAAIPELALETDPTRTIGAEQIEDVKKLAHALMQAGVKNGNTVGANQLAEARG